MTITEQAAAYADERSAVKKDRIALQRAFAAGALAAITSTQTREQMLAELVQFGRTIGSAVEIAQG